MSWYPSTATPMPCAPWFVCPRSLHGHTVSQVGFGVSGGHSVAAAAPEAVQGLEGLHWGSCAGTAPGPWRSYTGIMHGVHRGGLHQYWGGG